MAVRTTVAQTPTRKVVTAITMFTRSDNISSLDYIHVLIVLSKTDDDQDEETTGGAMEMVALQSSGGYCSFNHLYY